MADSDRAARQVTNDDIDALHRGILALVDQGCWSEQPVAAATVIAATLSNVLAFIVTHDPDRLPWVGGLLDDVAGLAREAADGAARSRVRQH